MSTQEISDAIWRVVVAYHQPPQRRITAGETCPKCGERRTPYPNGTRIKWNCGACQQRRRGGAS